MTDVQHVLIYATGEQNALCKMTWELLEAGFVLRGDLIERSRVYLKEDRKRKVGIKLWAVNLICEMGHLNDVMTAMRNSYDGSDFTAVAMPIIAGISK